MHDLFQLNDASLLLLNDLLELFDFFAGKRELPF